MKILGNILALLALGIAQVSFLTTWPAPVSNLHLLLSVVVFLAIILDYQRALWWALGGGLFLELYSGSSFGTIVLSLLLTVMAVNFLFTNFFTNRSFYSLMIIGFIATALYNILFWLGTVSVAVLGAPVVLSSGGFFSQFFWQPLFNLIVLAIIFVTYYFSTGRLKNIFLLNSAYETKWKR
jgi:cell shape-determining protein MreD